MTIASARATRVRLRFARPVRTARGSFDERESVILELRDADGRRGYGEAAPWPGFATESAREALVMLEDIARVLGGAAVEPGELVDSVHAGISLRGLPFADELQRAPASRAALHGAFCDLAARRANLPLGEYLARQVCGTQGDMLRAIAVHALLLDREPEALRLEAARVREAGFHAVKLKLGGVPLHDDIARVRAVRDQVGPGVALRGDANGAWSRSAALEALSALADFALEYVEQPLPADDIDGLAWLRGRAPVRVAADESVASGERARQLIEARAVDAMVLKPTMLGGPIEALQVAALATHAGIQVVFSHACESAVGARHALHCAAAWRDPGAVHGLCTDGLFAGDVAAPVASRLGVALVSGQPGLGVDL